MNKYTTPLASVLLVSAVGLTACDPSDPRLRTKAGAAIGAVAGAVIGHQVDGEKGRYVGLIAGGLVGAGVGNYMDKQQEELERELAKEAARNELLIERLPDDSLRIGIASQASFDVASSDLKVAFLPTYNKIAEVLQDFEKTMVHVVGHTDSRGTEEFNQGLSERRANSVAVYMSARNIPLERMRIRGAGELQPVANNETEAGRAQNRRVDIILKPIVQGREEEAEQTPGFVGG